MSADAPEPLLAAVRALVYEQGLFAQPAPQADLPTHVVVGVSGGADSSCLLHLLYCLAPEWSLALHVAHLDHSLRPASAAEAEHVRQLAHGLGLPFHSQKLAADALHNQPGGLENAARQARYHFLATVARQVTPTPQTPIIAVAHHADDQAETLLMNLVRGSGLHGLGAMRPVSRLDPAFLTDSDRAAGVTIRLVRPLLHVERSAILAYLQRHECPWVEDESNRNTAHTRNLLRWQVIPLLRQLNPNLTQTLLRTTEVAAAEAERIEQLDRAHFNELLLAHQPARIVLHVDQLCTLHKAAQRNIVRMAATLLLQDQGASSQAAPEPLTMQQVDVLLHALRGDPRASGPHPLSQTLSWTVAAQRSGAPAQLSLHHSDALPFQVNSPQLDSAWRTAVGGLPIVPGHSIYIHPWRLAAHVLPRHELPASWRSVSPWIAYLDAEQSGEPQLTTPQPGMRFAPLGLHGHTKSLGDFFTDRKIHPSLRAGWPIVVDGATGAILWVCGLHVAHSPRITNQTQQVLQLRWIE